MFDSNLGIELMKIGDFANARPMLERLVIEEPNDWTGYYMLGQCCRYLNDYNNAVIYLRQTIELNKNEPSVYLALGIVHQLLKHWDEAIIAFRIAIELDTDYSIAYNSLALTQKQMGHLELSLHNYDSGIKALSRKIVKSMTNVEGNKIYKHNNTPRNLWVEYVIFGGVYLVSMSNHIETMSWPNGEQAISEEKNEKHKGLYWVDLISSDNKNSRMYLPNFFNTFREKLKEERIYSDMIGNKGVVIKMMGNELEAEQHFEEAEYFSKSAG